MFSKKFMTFSIKEALVNGFPLTFSFFIELLINTSLLCNSTWIIYKPHQFKKQENNIKIYPNPVIDVLQISNTQGELNVKLYNLQGILLQQTNQNTLDFSDYKAGVYLLDINGQINKIVKK